MDGCSTALDSSASGINSTRQNIAVCLLQNTEDLANLCHICGEQAGDTNWIGCDSCSRWYHNTCAKRPPKKKKFICQACK